MISNSGFGFQRFTYSAPPEIPTMGTTYKTITINKTYVPSTQTNYIAKIPASILTSDFFTKLAIDGSPRFTLSDGTTELPYEEVYLDVSGSKGYYNVLVPTVNGTAEGSSTDIRVYYENTLSNYTATDTYGRNAVWANNFKCVQHLHTTPNLTQVNSTGNTNYDMTQTGTLLSTNVVTAMYGGGNAHFYDGTGQSIRTNYNDLTGYPFSMGLLFRTPTDAGDEGYIAGLSDATSASTVFGLYKFGLKTAKSLHALPGGISNAASIANMESTSWNFAMAVFTSATSRTLYLNSITPVTNTVSVTYHSNLNWLGIGGMNLNTDIFFLGDVAVQDFFLTAEAISANRFTTMYNNYTNGSFFTIT